MQEYGATAERLGQIAIVQRKFASNNPNAAGFGKALDMTLYMVSRARDLKQKEKAGSDLSRAPVFNPGSGTNDQLLPRGFEPFTGN